MLSDGTLSLVMAFTYHLEVFRNFLFKIGELPFEFSLHYNCSFTILSPVLCAVYCNVFPVNQVAVAHQVNKPLEHFFALLWMPFLKGSN